VLSLEYKGAGSSFFNPPATNNYDALRQQADRERRESKKAEPQVQDGRHGFGDAKGRRRRGDGQNKGLYSDEMMVDAPAVPISQRGRSFR
jgi:hypothetical protein